MLGFLHVDCLRGYPDGYGTYTEWLIGSYEPYERQIGKVHGRPRLHVGVRTGLSTGPELCVTKNKHRIYALSPAVNRGQGPVFWINRLPRTLIRHMMSFLLPTLSETEVWFRDSLCWSNRDISRMHSDTAISIPKMLWFYRPDNIFQCHIDVAISRENRDIITEFSPLTLAERATMLLKADTETYTIAERRVDWSTPDAINSLKKWFIKQSNTDDFEKYIYLIMQITGPFTQKEWFDAFFNTFYVTPPVLALAESQGFQMTEEIIQHVLKYDTNTIDMFLNTASTTGRFLTEIGNSLTHVDENMRWKVLRRLIEIYGSAAKTVDEIKPFWPPTDILTQEKEFTECALLSPRWSEFHDEIAIELFDQYDEDGDADGLRRIILYSIPEVNERIIGHLNATQTFATLDQIIVPLFQETVGTDSGLRVWRGLASQPVHDVFNLIDELVFSRSQIEWVLALNPYNTAFNNCIISVYMSKYPGLTRQYIRCEDGIDSPPECEDMMLYLICLCNGYKYPGPSCDHILRKLLRLYIARQNSMMVGLIMRSGRVQPRWTRRVGPWFWRCMYGSSLIM